MSQARLLPGRRSASEGPEPSKVVEVVGLVMLSVTPTCQGTEHPASGCQPAHLEACDPVRHRQAHHRRCGPQAPAAAAVSSRRSAAPSALAGPSCSCAEAGSSPNIIDLKAVARAPEALLVVALDAAVPPGDIAAAAAVGPAAAAAAAAMRRKPCHQPPVVQLHANARQAAAAAAAAAVAAAACCRPAAAARRDGTHCLLGADVPQHHPCSIACGRCSACSSQAASAHRTSAEQRCTQEMLFKGTGLRAGACRCRRQSGGLPLPG